MNWMTVSGFPKRARVESIADGEWGAVHGVPMFRHTK